MSSFLVTLVLLLIEFLVGHGAPLLPPSTSSVFVHFVSGNQATQYTHGGSMPESTSLHLNTLKKDMPHETIGRVGRSLTTQGHPMISTMTTMSPGRKTKKTILTFTTIPTDKTKSLTRKDPKTLKRSPFPQLIMDQHFPQFSDFHFFPSLGHSRNLDRRSKDGTHLLIKAESLAPEGLFLPPLPTAATNHLEEDVYLVDDEGAEYASQHPPYFHEFPHKRTLLALNEQRSENGLEPNLLRSIRPFFPFFEVNK